MRHRTSTLRRRSFYSSDRPSTATLRKHARSPPPPHRNTSQRFAALQRKFRTKTSSSQTSRTTPPEDTSGWGTDFDQLSDVDDNNGDDYVGGGRKSLAERTSLIVEAVGDIRVPSLDVRDVILAGYGGRWAADLVTFLNNSVRREICDLWIVLGSLNARILDVTLGELREFYAWFSGFENFVVRILKCEEEVLYPFVETRKRRGGVAGYAAIGNGLDVERLEGGLSTGNRMTTKGHIIRLIRDVSASAAGLHGYVRGKRGERDRERGGDLSVGFVAREGERQPADVLREVVDLARDFAGRLEKYFQEEELVLPQVIEQKYTEYEVKQDGLMRRIARCVWKGCRKDESTIMMTRWMESKYDVKLWASLVLRSYERMAMAIWKKKFDNGRARLVRDFASRRAGYDMEIASARKRRSMEITRRQLKAAQQGNGDSEENLQDGGEMMSRISSRATDVSRATDISDVSRGTDMSRVTEMSRATDRGKAANVMRKKRTGGRK